MRRIGHDMALIVGLMIQIERKSTQEIILNICSRDKVNCSQNDTNWS